MIKTKPFKRQNQTNHKREMLNDSEKANFYIAFLNDCHSYKKNSQKKIVTSKCIFGRDESATVIFVQEDETVSKRHASIEYDGRHFYLVHLSYSNPTLLNGKEITQVGTKQLLKNHDQIQLSRIGPLFQFREREVNKFSRFTQKFQHFIQNALLPYKIAVACLFCLMCIILGFNGYQYFKYEPLLKITEIIKNQQTSDSQKIIQLNRQNKALQSAIRQDFVFRNGSIGIKGSALNVIKTETSISEEIKKLSGSIYMIRAKSLLLEYIDGSKQRIELKDGQGWNGTGFLCVDGRFVTARHVIEPWVYFKNDDTDMIKLNMIETQGGKVTVYYEAQSPDFLTIKFSNHEFIFNNNDDCKTTGITASGESVALSRALPQNDWSYLKTKFKSGRISLDPILANTLSQTQQLHVMGYSNGEVLQDSNRLEPLYSTTTVAQTGLKRGFINISNRAFEVGNSGGPVFAALSDGKLVAIGIVVSKLGEIGRVLPVSAIK